VQAEVTRDMKAPVSRPIILADAKIAVLSTANGKETLIELLSLVALCDHHQLAVTKPHSSLCASLTSPSFVTTYRVDSATTPLQPPLVH
jgi:hypothetical protein